MYNFAVKKFENKSLLLQIYDIMRRLLLLFIIPLFVTSCHYDWFGPNTTPSKHVIYYTSIDGNTIDIHRNVIGEMFGARVLSNTYENGVGKMVFNCDITGVNTWFQGNGYLKTIILPASVNRIDDNAFNSLRLGQFINGAVPIEVRLSGSVTHVRLVQSTKIWSPIVVNPSCNSTSVRPSQHSYARSPMDVTLVGNFTSSNF